MHDENQDIAATREERPEDVPEFHFKDEWVDGSFALYRGYEFVARFAKQPYRELAKILSDTAAFIKHVGATSFGEARDTLIRTNAQNMDALQAAFDQVKQLAAENAALKAAHRVKG